MGETRIPTYLFEDDPSDIDAISAVVRQSSLLFLAGQAASPKSAMRLVDGAVNAQQTLFLLDGTLISPNREGQDGQILRDHIETVGPKTGWVIFSISGNPGGIPGVEVRLGKSFSVNKLETFVRKYFPRD